MYKAEARLFVGTVLVTVVLVVAPRVTAAQSLVCQTIRSGDTASAVARRLTGRADSRHQAWFRIVDPARSTVVRKAEYNRVRAGWHACVPARRLGARVPDSPPRLVVDQNVTSRPLSAPPPIPAQQPLTVFPPSRERVALELAYMWFALAAFGAAIGTGWQKIEQFRIKRRALIREMHGFAGAFVRDFEWPLVAGTADRPIRARLRCVPANRRLDILLAPAAGRRYPNLDDHRQNVEYDVERITLRLKDRPFVRRPLRAEGQWVVIPFQFEPGPRTRVVV